jgi:hypothetical protein
MSIRFCEHAYRIPYSGRREAGFVMRSTGNVLSA